MLPISLNSGIYTQLRDIPVNHLRDPIMMYSITVKYIP